VEPGRVLRVGERYLRYRAGRPSPVFCNYFMTARCNLRCSYCPVRNPTGSPIFPFCRRTREVGTEEAKRMVAEAAELGVLWMSFSGGEPLLREDLEEVAGEGRERGMVTILDTNATLVTERRARNLARVFEVAVVSLQGMEEVNDAMRGPGVFRRTLRGMELLREEGVQVGVNFIITHRNYGEMEKVVEFLGERVDSIVFNPVCQAEAFRPRGREVEEVERSLLRLKRENPRLIYNSPQHLRAIGRYLRGEKVVECQPFDLHFSLMPGGELCGCFYPLPVGRLEGNGRELLERGRRMRERLFRECGGCANSSYFHVSHLFRAPPPALLLRRFSP